MIKTVIVDDEPNSCEVIRGMLHDYFPLADVVGVEHRASAAVKTIRQLRPDVVLLDIHLGEASGFTVLDALREVPFRVIFVTAYDQYAIRAIRYAALDYLVKPVNLDELLAAMSRLQSAQTIQHLEKQVSVLSQALSAADHAHKIVFPGIHEMVFSDMKDVLWLKADHNYTIFHLENRKQVCVAKTLKYYEEVLPHPPFYRIHHSHMINLSRVAKYLRGKGGAVVLSDGSELEVSPKKKDELLKMLNYGR